jgi:hypothetical protein
MEQQSNFWHRYLANRSHRTALQFFDAKQDQCVRLVVYLEGIGIPSDTFEFGPLERRRTETDLHRIFADKEHSLLVSSTCG